MCSKLVSVACATIQYIESIIDRVVNLFTHLRSLHGRFLRGPILGLFLSPFLGGLKMGQNWSVCKI